MTMRETLAWGTGGVVGFIVLWSIAAMPADPVVLPSPGATGSALWALVSDAEALRDLRITLVRIATGFVVGVTVGVVLGYATAMHPVIRAAIEPYTTFLRSVTPIAWIGPATLWLGTGSTSILFIVIYATMIPVAINTLSGMLLVPLDQLRMARVFGIGHVSTVFQVRFRHAIPAVLTGIRLSLGYAVMTVVGAEMIVGTDGLGFRVYSARVFYDTPTMFAGLLLLGLLGLIADRGVQVASSAYHRRIGLAG